ncbi:DNA helicase II [Pantoea sp. Mhis]|uniref:DNA helicase II n=1 Tax=Pantoea sp. Mhis TaxID=2576759 RepID=UPI001356F3DF|nr:DNA helicase II [Pantoea sp. Mhis]MXP56421.1 DNA helicase II [Pantoea sp. Mhis]
MNTPNLLNNLNEQQRAAVTTNYNSLLILAGAGSGKTRVLVHRIAWLISIANYSPLSIIAVTFTNKAAAEMRNRIINLIGTLQDGMWIGTFHGLAHRLLRIHHVDANLPHDFQIIDNEDQLRLLKRLIKELNLDEKKWSVQYALWYINNKKDNGLRAHDIKNHDNSKEQTWLRIYQAYQETCNRSGLVDFSELLLRIYELWINHSYLLCQYRIRFSHILIDEFQDVNHIQYAWIRMLAGDTGHIIIVGDDDQSIYGWRGAKVENIQKFLHDFPESQIIRLEQNYRSKNNILKAANALIMNNNTRLGKKLWTHEIDGELISIYRASNDIDEARFVVDHIKDYHKNGNMLSNCTILYRSNSQSRVLEEALRESRIAYRIYSGIRFFERKEIKDALAYLRLIVNHDDDSAFERIINIPLRGIGDRTLSLIREIARKKQLTLWKATSYILNNNILSNRIILILQNFCNLINSLTLEITGLPLHIQISQVIKNSGLWLMYKQDKGEQARMRLDNLKELITATHQFQYQQDTNLIPLHAFLSHAMLESGEVDNDKHQDAVQLMTLHAAKGLEFNIVFIVGMEEGIFPTQMSLNKYSLLEEERRLAYVGLTRAINQLILTYAEKRYLYGKVVHHNPSRFLDEIPKNCVKEITLLKNINQTINYKQNKIFLSNSDNKFIIGQRVRHITFGEGTIINFEGLGKECRLQIAFQDKSVKWLIAIYSSLEII